MELKFNATIELKPDDLKKIIEDAIRQQMKDYTIKSVRFETGTDYGPMDRGPGMPVFTGVKVSVEPRRRAEF